MHDFSLAVVLVDARASALLAPASYVEWLNLELRFGWSSNKFSGIGSERRRIREVDRRTSRLRLPREHPHVIDTTHDDRVEEGMFLGNDLTTPSLGAKVLRDV
jgi:hypothetical protein